MEILIDKVDNNQIDYSTLKSDLLLRYESLCGNYGRTTFKRVFLPSAMKFYKKAPKIAIREILEIMDKASDCNRKKIDSYLFSAKFGPKNNPIKRLSNLENSLTGLKIAVIKYNFHLG